MSKQIISTTKAPAAIGPYNQAIKVGNTVYSSGQIGMDPSNGNLVSGGVEAEARQALTNLSAVLEEAGGSLSNVVKTTCFLADMNDFVAFNKVYQEFFTSNFPARSTFAVAGLPKGARVEVEAIAFLE